MKSCEPLQHIVIVGGGASGWLMANYLGQRFVGSRVKVTIIESPDVPTIGVGEGTVPALKQAMRRFGIAEQTLIQQADATFKQGICFRQWRKPHPNGDMHHYYHPFDVLTAEQHALLRQHLQSAAHVAHETAFVAASNLHQSALDAISIQGVICDHHRAPKTASQPDYQGVVDYAYHFDAAKFGAILKHNALQKYDVLLVTATVQQVIRQPSGGIAQLLTDKAGAVSADLFIDCTGFHALLIGQHLDVPFVDQSHILPVDHALAMQVPATSDMLPSCTGATAQDAGWIWDIALQQRRGVGYVYSSAHQSHHDAEQRLRTYIGAAADGLTCRRIPMRVGYRQVSWQHNCVAIGLAQGFVEPLEATALLMTDLAALLFTERLPMQMSHMAVVRDDFNRTMQHGWQRVLEFIKLHYLLSDRDDSDFWHDVRHGDTVPTALTQRLALWHDRLPNTFDFASRFDVFNLDNYLYVLYGMNFQSRDPMLGAHYSSAQWQQLRQRQQQLRQAQQLALTQLPSHRALIRQLRGHSGG